MEIYFCDLCNESVPQSDLDTGQAFVRKGRVVCAACDRAMGGAGEEAGGDAAGEKAREAQLRPAPAAFGSAPGPAHARQPAERRAEGPVAAVRAGGSAAAGGGGGVLVGMLALVFAAGGFALLVGKVDDVAEGVQQASATARRDVDAMRRSQDAFIQSLDARFMNSEERIHSRRDAGRKVLEKSLASLRKELATTGERLDQSSERVAAVQALIAEGDRANERRVEELTEALLSMEKDMRFYSDRMIEMEETLRGISSRPGTLTPSGSRAASGGSDAPGPIAKAWDGLLPDLQHANAGIRLDAVYALGETGDRDVIPYLIPMLSDVDLFVRMATARVLEDLEAKTAVPALIDALEDPSSAVREAAMVALRHITGQDFRFEPTAQSDAKRAKAVKAWRDWWKKSGDDFLATR